MFFHLVGMGRVGKHRPDIEFKTMSGTDIREIHAAFQLAFSDYRLKMDMPADRFRQMLENNDYRPDLSVGAFSDGMLVGFILNGARIVCGRCRAYDSGTGVVPQYRRQGITRGMFELVFRLFDRAGVCEYMLEALVTNNTALDIYQSRGFEITRELECYHAGREVLRFAGRPDIVPVETYDCLTGTEEFSRCRDFCPTWQNADETVSHTAESCAAAVCRIGGALAGYGIINRRTGAVYQLAVSREFRRQGVGSGLMAELVGRTQSREISFLNIDTGCRSMALFLTRNGFLPMARQYEMKKTLIPAGGPVSPAVAENCGDPGKTPD